MATRGAASWLCAGIVTACCGSAQATFHFMQIEQVIGGINGDTTAQAVQLRMRTVGQNFIAQGRLRVHDAQGLNPVLLIDFTTNVIGGTGRRILVTTPSFDSQTNPTTVPDFTMTNPIPASYLAAGSLTFESDFGIVYWRLSWGGAGYTGPTTGDFTNDSDGQFGPPFAGPLPSTTLQALLFQGSATAMSTNNAADYALTLGAAVFTNNLQASFTVTGPVAACCTGFPNPVCTNTSEAGCAGVFFAAEDCATFTCPQCITDTDCDDGVACTVDQCVTGACVNSGGTTCAPFEECNVNNGLCQPGIEAYLVPVADGLCSPVLLTHAGDGSGRRFVVDQCGTIRVIGPFGFMSPTPFLDLTSKIVTVDPGFDERGLLGLAFHPNYETNGRFFVRYSAPRVGVMGEPCFGTSRGCHKEVLAEYSVSAGNANIADPNSEIILFEVDEPQFNHDSGDVVFGPDGLLYFTLGDGGGANDGLADMPPSHGPVGNGQNVSTALGNVLRIDVDGPPDPGLNYAVPPGNPFAGGGGVPEIYAYGFRNPCRFSFDDGPGGDGAMYVADVGQNLYEELNILPVLAAPGLLNYGWVLREGYHCFDPLDPLNPPPTCPDTGAGAESLIAPALEYDHTVGIAVIGGFVYRGSQFPALSGKYVFGDFSTGFGVGDGRLFYADIAGPAAFVRGEFTLLPGGGPFGHYLKGLGEDEDGEIYVLASDVLAPTGTTGVVLKFSPEEPPPIPTVSQWGTVVMALLLLSAGTIAFRPRRNARAPA